MSTRCANCSDADKAVAQARRERDILRAKLAEVERDLHSTEIENEAMTNRYVPLVEKYEATRSRVAALEHAGRLVIRECNCGDIEACSVCGPLDAALGTAAYAPGTFTMTMKEIPPEFSPIEPTLLDDEDAEKKGGRCERCGGKREWTDLLDGRKYPCPACQPPVPSGPREGDDECPHCEKDEVEVTARYLDGSQMERCRACGKEWLHGFGKAHPAATGEGCRVDVLGVKPTLCGSDRSLLGAMPGLKTEAEIEADWMGRYACSKCKKEYPSMYAAECCPCYGEKKNLCGSEQDDEDTYRRRVAQAREPAGGGK